MASLRSQHACSPSAMERGPCARSLQSHSEAAAPPDNRAHRLRSGIDPLKAQALGVVRSIVATGDAP